MPEYTTASRIDDMLGGSLYRYLPGSFAAYDDI